jgi:uncharacterized membrane protein
MKKKIYLLLCVAIIFLIVISIFVRYTANGPHYNTNLNWIGKTENNEWIAEIHYDKVQKSYSGYVFWRGSKDHLRKIDDVTYKYYEGKKLMTSSSNPKKVNQGSFGFLDFGSQPKGRVVLKFSYFDSGKKVSHIIFFHSSTYHYSFYTDKNLH